MSFEERRLDFRTFDANGGRFALTWNWYACAFGPFWYMYQGMWAKAFVYGFLILFAASLTGGFGLFGGPLVLGVVGNYDLYLLRRHGTRFWDMRPDAPTTVGSHLTMPTAGLAELQALRDQGLLTDEEFEAKRARILQGAENARAIATLERALRAGVITHEEYERKKQALRR